MSLVINGLISRAEEIVPIHKNRHTEEIKNVEKPKWTKNGNTEIFVALRK